MALFENESDNAFGFMFDRNFMLIEQPPILYRLFYPKAIWRIPSETGKVVYLTFDDGPIPEVTPWVIDLLDKYNVKATFFCVGDNVRKHPQIYQMILDREHGVGNHTYNHLQGISKSSSHYNTNVALGSQYVHSKLFRPPHGHMRMNQYRKLSKQYKIVMWDVVTRDYSNNRTPEQVLNTVKKYTRNGSVIVFHDSLKAEKNMKYALPLAIEWLKEEGYEFKLL